MTTPKPPKPGPLPRRVDAAELLRLGKLGRFRLLDKLGEGAMGSVMLAEDITLRRRCALKLLPCVTDTAEQRMFLEQFVREARSAAALVHHAIVQIFQVGVAQGYAYIAMELLDGPNLDELVKKQGPLPVAQACSLIAEAAEGLGYAHEQGILHRDIKPANLVITSRGRSKVCDFGVAQISDPQDKFKLPYNVVGTPYYLSPEAARGESSPNADLWALAGSLWFLLTGKPPFAIKTPADARRVHVDVPLPDIRELRPDIPEGLAHLLERALSLEINRRYHSGDELAEALRPFTIAGDGVAVATVVEAGARPSLAEASRAPAPQAEPSGRTAVGVRRRRRKHTVPLVVGGLFALVLLLVIGGVVAAILLGRQPIGEAATASRDAAPTNRVTEPTPSEPAQHMAAEETEPTPLPPVVVQPPPRDLGPTPDTQPEPAPYQPSAEVFEKPEPKGLLKGLDIDPPPAETRVEVQDQPKQPPTPQEPEDSDATPLTPAPAQTQTATQEPQPLDIGDREALIAAARDQLGQPFVVTGQVGRAGQYRGDWHLILRGDTEMRIVIDGEAAEAVAAKLERPIKSLESMSISARGTLDTLDGQGHRPLILVTEPEQISLLETP